MCSPIFLYRTLTYMKSRMSRSHKARATFKVDSLLEKITNKNKNFPAVLPGYMNITFHGFYDGKIEPNIANVKIEPVLVKISHKKRKDSSAPLMETSFGEATVPVNPKNENCSTGNNTGMNSSPTVSVPTKSFTITGSNTWAKSYVLLLRVKPNYESIKNDHEPEPLTKKRKSNIDEKLFVSELVIYDKYNRCLLTDADYELTLTEVNKNAKNSPKKHSSWENVDELQKNNFDEFLKGPSIKFKLNWSQEPFNQLKERVTNENNKENIEFASKNKKEKLQVVYQFVYNNNSRQQTEGCEHLNCPWCSLNCTQLYVLLKHLKLCHSRFTFTYVPISIGARIDVAINELYDGSYTGSPHDLIALPTVCAFSRNGPVRRASVTHILVCHPKRQKPSLSEFLELDDCEYDGQRPFITGHNRLYHHTTTCLPIYPKEMDMDSEGENDPEWLRAKTMMMIDEFTDVNEGEKELMKMWNLHTMKYGFVGDCQIPMACGMFVQHKGKELLSKNLYRNFVVHLCSLFDFGLISAFCFYQCIQKLQDIVCETLPLRNILRESREAQVDNWAKIGISQVVQPERSTTNVPTKTPTGRKTANVHQRRKGTPTPSEMPLRRKSVNTESTSRKRLSLTLKSEQKN